MSIANYNSMATAGSLMSMFAYLCSLTLEGPQCVYARPGHVKVRRSAAGRIVSLTCRDVCIRIDLGMDNMLVLTYLYTDDLQAITSLRCDERCLHNVIEAYAKMPQPYPKLRR